MGGISVKTSHIFIAIVIVLLVLIVVLLRAVSNIDVEQYDVEFPGTQRNMLKQNCDVETIYSVEDSQCEIICKQPGIFVSRNGVCVNILAFSQEAVENSCDPKKGVLAYLLGDPQFGKTKLLCLSIDQGVQPDDVTQENTICAGGSIDINYVKSFPQLYSCSCPDDHFLALIPNTSTIRQRGVCVKNELRNVYDLNKLVYDKNAM
ncbi:pif-3 [Oryctes rhinoceros nudivirus]|uniref:Pif-3 n=1 Tax=Oryctes rhinoceros nudivirus TaxID=92521 RepID=A0A6B9QQJ1_9VIRU|nr:pif-3 [Oryctes rhinoceros nudivirus]ACH96237.1 pif-3 [Oryctes rhinoceros nudivirus]QHG11339.1 pif-3 protein [Oryctes rhinoceros nudivirus]QKE59570.1 pif-3 [Oryctes rhinoceros nudivirus]UBO76517.1 PIF-3 [Oryctes rhinoceros nudivirus]UBR58284.1 PIF-3 protein [Oryctes rhinoceros nudivirus]